MNAAAFCRARLTVLDRKQRENLAKILINLGSAGFIGLVVGRLVSPATVSLTDMLLGLVFSGVCFVTVLLIEREEK